MVISDKGGNTEQMRQELEKRAAQTVFSLLRRKMSLGYLRRGRRK